MTIDRLSAKDPAFGKAVREGLDWTVVRVFRSETLICFCWAGLISQAVMFEWFLGTWSIRERFQDNLSPRLGGSGSVVSR